MFCLVITVFCQDTKVDYEAILTALLEKEQNTLIEGTRLYNAGNYKDAKEILISCLRVQNCQIMWDEITRKELENDYKELLESRKKEDTLNKSSRAIEDLTWRYTLSSTSLNSPRSIDLILLQTRIAVEMGFNDIAKEKIAIAMQIAPTNLQVLSLYKELGEPRFETNKSFDLKNKYVISDSRSNLGDIYIKLSSFRSLVKDEFETTEQFNKRLEEAKQITFLGELKLGSYIDVPFESIKGLTSSFSYNADENKIDLKFLFDEYSSFRYLPNYNFNKQTGGENYEIIIKNFEDFNFYKKNRFTRNEIIESILLVPEIAKEVKPNLRALVVVQFVEPYTDKCKDCNNRKFFADLEEIWVYDRRTGFVYEKIKNIPKRLRVANELYKVGNYKDSLEHLDFSMPNRLNNLNTNFEKELLEAKNRIVLKQIDWAILNLEIACNNQKLLLFSPESLSFKLALNKNKASLTSLEKVNSLVKIFPKESVKPESFLLLAKLYQQKGNARKAIIALNYLLEIYPYLKEAVFMKNSLSQKGLKRRNK